MRVVFITRIVILCLMHFVISFLIPNGSRLISLGEEHFSQDEYYDKFYGPIVTKTNTIDNASALQDERKKEHAFFSERVNSTDSNSGINQVMEDTIVVTVHPFFNGNQTKLTTTTTNARSKELISRMEGGAGTTYYYYYSHARRDRSGAAIQDMILSHAYTYHRGMQYGGACSRNWNGARFRGKRELRLRLLQAVGLETVLPLAEQCPSNKSQMLHRDDYIANDTQILSSDYLQYLRSIVRYPEEEEEENSFTIGIHIRRGDIGPCRPLTRNYHRYLPNSHFTRLVDYYIAQQHAKQGESSKIPSTVQVTIYSESESFESFDVFEQRGYNVILDGSIEDVWKGLVTKDVIILSRSSFSLVPAILSRGVVVYTPFWHNPLPTWEVVNEQFMNQTLSEYHQIVAKNCPDQFL